MVLVNPNDGITPSEGVQMQETIRVKQPKRILHFSDGVLEEYSSDEEEVDSEQVKEPPIDPTTLPWLPWVWYKTWAAGSSTVSVVDAVGEYLAAFFGITTPKYYFELEEYKKEMAEKEREQAEYVGWEAKKEEGGVEATQPTSV